ncbi:Cupredoxin-like domain protein [uncultured archaeon]|nr:Cupredoxin-like domain protein [uncultured archaeon]
MEDKCPKCGETLITRTIKKKIGLGSIEYPVAQTCPKCNWNKDLTGAGDVVAKPVIQDAGEAKKEEKKAQITPQVKPLDLTGTSKPAASPSSINSLIMIVLAILVVGAIAWVFFVDTAEEKQGNPVATPTPIITTPVPTPAATVVPEVTASGKQTSVKLETNRGINPQSVTIKAGDEVVWTNDGTYAVTLVSSDGLFEDKFLNNAKRTNYTFKKTGTFSFYLKDDKNLAGTIIVEP